MPYSVLYGALLALVTTLPLARMWRLNVRRAAYVVIILALLSGVAVAHLQNLLVVGVTLQVGLVWLMTLTSALAILTYRFYRDPERRVSDREDLVISPADGEVIYVRESRRGVLPLSTKHGNNYTLRELVRTPLYSEEAVVIGISMSYLDVHVNRAPIKGRITFQQHFPGRFGSLKLAQMVFENERVTTVIERDDLQVAVVQIASRLVRQILSFVRVNQEVALGQRIGMIRLGSQVDLVLPVREDLKVMIKPGERVRAGESAVAVFTRAGGSAIQTLGLPSQEAMAGEIEQAWAPSVLKEI